MEEKGERNGGERRRRDAKMDENELSQELQTTKIGNNL
jgi:hypothetical protein